MSAVAPILIVDDDELIRDTVRLLLEEGGHRVSEAADGSETLLQLEADPPAVVVLDVAMPGVDGWEALARIRERSPVPVVMLTASSTEEECVRGLRAGADDYVVKPFDPEELVVRVERLLVQPG